MKKQSGFTLVEISVVVLIGIILLGLVFVLKPQVMAKINAMSETSLLKDAISQIQAKFISYPDFAQLNDSVIIGNNIVPKEMVSGSAIVNRWSGQVTFTPTAHPGNGALASGAFMISDQNVESAACSKIADGLSKDVLTMSVGGTTVLAYKGQLDQAALGTACNSQPNVTMQFVAGKA